MKRFLIVLIALLTMAAFVSVPDAAAKKPKALKASGVVAVYDKDKNTLTITTKDGKDMIFEVAGDAKVKGEVKKDVTVTVTYTEADGKMTATAIKVAPPAKAPKKAK